MRSYIETPLEDIKTKAYDHSDHADSELSEIFQEGFILGYLIAQAEIDEKYQRIQEGDREIQESKRKSCQ